jgi:hypothetical protein
MAVDYNCLRQQCDQEQTAPQIAQNLVTQCKAAIQQLQSRNQETTTESNTYQDWITILQYKSNHKYTNAKVLLAAAVADAAPEQ